MCIMKKGLDFCHLQEEYLKARFWDLFFFSFNDLPLVLNHCKIILYADDVQLYASCKPQNIDDSIKNINDDLTKVCQWARGNGLSLNPSKSKCIIITRLKIDYTTISRA